MNAEDAKAATREAVEAARALSAHLQRLKVRLVPAFPIDEARLAGWGDEDRERLHAFCRMFEQLQDMVSRKLFRGILTLSGEDPASLSARNLFRRLERIGALANADRWIEIATVRNALVHDYPTTPAQQAKLANLAWEALDDLIAANGQALAYIEREALA